MIAEPLLILGAGGQARVVADIATALGHRRLLFCAADLPEPTRRLGHPWQPRPPDHWQGSYVVAIGDNARRAANDAAFRAAHAAARAISLVHPAAVVSPAALLGAGTVVMAGALVGTGSRVGCGAIINSGASLDHDGLLGDFTSLGPAACLGGGVHLGEASAVCLGARVLHGIRIGADVVVGAAALVLHDLPDGCVAYGTPARVVRRRRRGDPYL